MGAFLLGARCFWASKRVRSGFVWRNASLNYGVEDAGVGCGVGTAASGPLPAQHIAGGVGIDEGVPEPAFAEFPVVEEILGEP